MKNRVRIKHWQLVTLYLIIYDFAVAVFSYGAALWLRFDCRLSAIPEEYMTPFLRWILVYAAVTIVVFSIMRLYRSIWRFASYNELLRIFLAHIGLIAGMLLVSLLFIYRMPISFYVFGIAIQFFLTVLARFSYRFVLLLRGRRAEGSYGDGAKPVLVIGAGAAGQQIIREIKMTRKMNEEVCGIIDDNPNKWGRYIDGIKVIGGRDCILSAVGENEIQKIYVAIPSANPTERRDILNICKETGCELKNLPGVYKIASGEVMISAMREVAVEDLLGREPVKVDLHEIFEVIDGKTILVTGGGGSIGSEICRQIATHNPKRLIIFDIYENNAYDIQNELKREHPNLNLTVQIGSVRDFRRVFCVFKEFKPDIVYHAAAHKHVPLMEESPCEAVKNNVFGTYNVAYAALQSGTKKFVLISTDKAVNPTNIMGATKRVCEMIVQTFNYYVENKIAYELPMAGDLAWVTPDSRACTEYCTEFAAVRFGNVLGSNGSVIPLFKKQIAQGGPVTVTHPDIIRYFMTIPEAVSLVLQAGVYADGGEIFVLDMGDPVKIDDLARNLIKLSGHRPDEDIKVEYTGLRPGEKLYEEKLMAEEGLERSNNKLIHIGKPLKFDMEGFLAKLEALRKSAYSNDEAIKQVVAGMVDTYRPQIEHNE